ncbi:hypothetical protein Moror_7863 [Moniliophthora roreri MCA 2997]|uniref:GST N-terminal domain-containing protein n=2 Tax=Moniliophthora roreri TaxID=221103 RepID=V2X8J2_MONRO|nr:hypothetical protein Moror_7863 [Moniliophthora roreri MCA 2997]
MTKLIRFYDIPSKLGKAWSSNTLKTMYTLNYKGIPYELIWVEYPDIESTCKSIGAPPTSKKADGRPHYTLPIIHDPNTGASIAESFAIAEYLEKTYLNPEKSVIPPGTEALQKAFLDMLQGKVFAVLNQLRLPRTAEILNPPSEEYFRRTRAAMVGKPLTELELKGEKRVEAWKQVEAGYGAIDAWLKKEDQYVMGDRISFVDFALASSLIYIRILWGEDSEEWKNICSWHNGRWGRLVKDFGAYERLA